jgi:hypothetical protein
LVSGFALGIDGARPILEEWNQGCQPPWSARELEHKLNQAKKEENADTVGAKLRENSIESAREAFSQEISPGVYLFADGVQVSLLGILEEARRKRQLRENAIAPTEQQKGFVDVVDLINDYPELRGQIISGILRRGECCAIIAAPKTGKSFLALDLAITVATGQPWLGFPTERGKVLIIDNELHPETIAHRLKEICKSRGIEYSTLRGQIEIYSVRGLDLGFVALQERIEARAKPGEFQLVILDALYRMLEQRMSENDNADMTRLVNQVERLASYLQAAVVVVHHTSKGDQSQKGVTDVGAGGGSLARAVDTHFVIRPHENEGFAVIDASVRSFGELKTKTVRFNFPIWKAADDIEPVLKTLRKSEKKREEERKARLELEEIENINQLLGLIPSEGINQSGLCNLTIWGDARSKKIIGRAKVRGAVQVEEYKKGKRDCYWVKKLMEHYEPHQAEPPIPTANRLAKAPT